MSRPSPTRTPRGVHRDRPARRDRSAVSERGTERRSPRTGAHRGPTIVATMPNVTVLFIAVVVLLNVFGVVMVLSASSVVSMTEFGSVWHVFLRQLIWTGLGVVAFFVAMRVDVRRWQRLAVPLTIAALALCLVVLIPHVGIAVSGSRRWLGVSWLRFQPSELAKLAVLLFSADLLTRRADRVWDAWVILKPLGVVCGTLTLLVLIEPDLDSTVVIALILVSVLVAGGLRVRHLMALLTGGIVLTAIAAVAEPYRRARVMTLLHPAKDASNTGYQIVQSMIALGSGGLTGVGLGAGSAKWHFLPNAHTDFVFSIIGEELGLLGCLTVLVLFVGFAAFGLTIALRAPDRFSMLLGVGIVVWVTSQAAINVAGVIGLLPVSGIPLPFVSFGGSSLVVTMVASGMLANIGRART